MNKYANVIVGENNSEKTAFIDTLRLMLNLRQGRREIYFTKDDFHVNNEGIKSKEAEIKMIFKDLSIEDQAVFYELLVVKDKIENSVVKLNIRYTLDETIKGLE